LKYIGGSNAPFFCAVPRFLRLLSIFGRTSGSAHTALTVAEVQPIRCGKSIDVLRRATTLDTIFVNDISVVHGEHS
jgi:hypothetical protein